MNADANGRARRRARGDLADAMPFPRTYLFDLDSAHIREHAELTKLRTEGLCVIEDNNPAPTIGESGIAVDKTVEVPDDRERGRALCVQSRPYVF